MRKAETRFVFLQRSLLRKKKGSSNRNKARLQVARLHEKIANQRNDVLHKVTNEITNENQIIVIEDLKVKNMQKKSQVSKSD
ncbi:transposase [Bacillus toyonensis]|uniref:transposase n=1 Tax=Bacillus toyonensis TaxID=155322 RepID=UPI00211D3EDB|nr:transposase [Bacillus toyonensis]